MKKLLSTRHKVQLLSQGQATSPAILVRHGLEAEPLQGSLHEMLRYHKQQWILGSQPSIREHKGSFREGEGEKALRKMKWQQLTEGQ